MEWRGPPSLPCCRPRVLRRTSRASAMHRDQRGNRRGIHPGARRVMLRVPLGAGPAHVVALRPVRIDQAAQRSAEVGKIRRKARGGRPLLMGASHGGSHFASTACSVHQDSDGEEPVHSTEVELHATFRLRNAYLGLGSATVRLRRISRRHSHTCAPKAARTDHCRQRRASASSSCPLRSCQ
jgi:hypothetical protein